MPCASAISGVLSALTLAAAGAPAPTVIGTEAAFPPYIFRDDAGNLVGFDREVGDEVCRRARLDCTWEVAEFDQLIPGVIAGRFDIAISGIAVTPERDRVIDFTIPYSEAGGSDHFVGRPGAPAVGAARIGVQSGTIHESHLRKTGRAFRSYRSEAALFDALIAGQIDLAYGPFDGDERAEFLSAEGLALLSEETVDSGGVAMVVCQGNHSLRERLDAAIAAMQNDGTMETISNQWF
jgi:ABC-type amino acid transport substrate-binding protein